MNTSQAKVHGAPGLAPWFERALASLAPLPLSADADVARRDDRRVSRLAVQPVGPSRP